MPLTSCAPRSSVHPARLCHSAAVSVPVALFGFQAAFGYWPDFKDAEDMKKLGAEAFAFVNVARFAVPLRIGLALGAVPWVQANIVDKFSPRWEERRSPLRVMAELPGGAYQSDM